MTDIDIDAIRERERVILPGPWRVGEMVPTGPDLWQLPILLDREGPDGPDTIEVCAVEYETGGFHYPHADAKADAEFIAHARTDIPALLDRLDLANAAGDALRNSVDALTAEVARLRADQMKAQLGGATDQAYLIWSHHHDAWWGPNARGYRGNVADAGRYALADTKKHLGRGCYCCPVPEVAVPAPLPGQMDSASLVNLIAVATEAEVAAGRVNKHADTAVTA